MLANSQGGKRGLGLPSWLLLSALLVLAFFGKSTQAATAGFDTLSDSCKEKLFPVSSGGSKDEKVSCTLYDK